LDRGGDDPTSECAGDDQNGPDRPGEFSHGEPLAWLLASSSLPRFPRRRGVRPTRCAGEGPGPRVRAAVPAALRLCLFSSCLTRSRTVRCATVVRDWSSWRGGAGLQCGDRWEVLRPVRVEVDDVAQFLMR
jgi:hypothetical protein